jgi:hypothetical protein
LSRQSDAIPWQNDRFVQSTQGSCPCPCQRREKVISKQQRKMTIFGRKRIFFGRKKQT